MKFFASVALILNFVFLVSVSSAVEVRRIEFNKVSFEGSEHWWQCAVDVEVERDVLDLKRRDPDFIDDLDVQLMLGVETHRGAKSGFEFFAATARLVSLERGKHVVRFYLPPEIVDRDDVDGEPYSYLVRFSRGGEVLGESVSRRLEKAQVKNSFLGRVLRDGVKNQGVLRAQNESPFSSEYARSTPSYKCDDLGTGGGTNESSKEH